MTLRVLALCGFTQNATIYSRQLGAVRKACKDVEFIFLEPPIVVEKADMPWNQSMDEFDSNATTDEAAQTAETTPRAWWLSNGDRTVYRRHEETLKYVHDFLQKEPPFDGIMGFSQGGSMAAIVAAFVEKPDLTPMWPSSNPPIAKFKFLISVGGFYPASKEPNFDAYFPLPASLPTLHIIGRNDVVVPIERSQTLIDKCENARVELHDGGHFTPSKASWRHFLNAYINSFRPDGAKGDIPPPYMFGPKSGQNSGVNSGVSTPVATDL